MSCDFLVGSDEYFERLNVRIFHDLSIGKEGDFDLNVAEARTTSNEGRPSTGSVSDLTFRSCDARSRAAIVPRWSSAMALIPLLSVVAAADVFTSSRAFPCTEI